MRRYPPGDHLLQRLIAMLCAMTAQGQVHPSQFAPWLDWSVPPKEGGTLEEDSMDAILEKMEA